MLHIIDFFQDAIIMLTSLVTVASTITAFTNTPPDTTLQGKLYKLIELMALVTEKTKQK